MKSYIKALFGAVLLSLCLTACTNTTSIGGDLLEGDLQNVQFSDDFIIRTSTLPSDSVRTFSTLLSAQLPEYLLGAYNDPIFGEVSSSIFAQFSLNGAAPDFHSEDAATVLDSVILVLPYRTTADYGDFDSEYDIEVFKMTEYVRPDQSFWSDTVFAFDPLPIGQISTMINNRENDTVFVNVPKNDALGTVLRPERAQMRIRLDDDFAQELFTVSEDDLISDTIFRQAFNGLHIRSNSVNEGLFGLDLLNLNSSDTVNVNAGVYVYYHNDTLTQFYRFPFKAADLKMTHYEYDYTGAVVEDFISDSAAGDSLFFVQGLSGVSGEIELADLSVLEDGDVAINRAELIIKVADLPEDTDAYPAPAQLILSQVTETGNGAVIEDVISALSSEQTSSLTPGLFGGNLISDGTVTSYTMNVTAHLQNILRGAASNKMRVTVFQRNRFANRAVFFGGGHSESPVRLRVYYTKF